MPENKDVCLGLMTWKEIESRLKESSIALIPVGQTEQHGLHASIDLDTRNAEGIAIRAALSAFNSSKPVVAPAICYGYSDLPGLRDYPGVFSLRGETLVNLCYDVAFSLIRMGFTKIIFVNGHDANPPFIKEAMRLLTKKTGAFCAMAHISEMNNSAAEEILIEAERAEAISTLLQQISEQEREIVTLKFWGGLKNKEIAEQLGINQNNVNVIVFRALKKLKLL